jgi:hypothetical protein
MKKLLFAVLMALWSSAAFAQQVDVQQVNLLGGPCLMHSGSGSPNSAVVGNVCDIWIDSVAGLLYTKTSGVGTNTGWVSVGSGLTTVPNGGTGVATLAAHGVLLGAGTSAVVVSGAGTAGQVLMSNGAAADPTFQAAPVPYTGATGDVTLGTHNFTATNDIATGGISVRGAAVAGETGAGLELFYNGTTGVVQAYDRLNSLWLPVGISGLGVSLTPVSGSGVTISTSGAGSTTVNGPFIVNGSTTGITTNGFIVSGSIGAATPSAGDVLANRGGASPGTGVVFFGSSANANYLQYDGTNFNFVGAPVVVPNLTVTGTATLGTMTTTNAITTASYVRAGPLNSTSPSPGDLIANRGGVPGTGVVFFGGSANAHYLFYDGTNFNFVGSPVAMPSDIVPLLIGGTGATQNLTFKTTTGTDTTGDQFLWVNGANGGTTAMSLYYNSAWNTTGASALIINGGVGSNNSGLNIKGIGSNAMTFTAGSGASTYAFFTEPYDGYYWAFGEGVVAVDDFGILDYSNGLAIPFQILGSGDQLVFNQKAAWKATGQGQLSLMMQNSLTTGVGIDVSTNNLFKFRTLAQTGDASMSALNGTFSGSVSATTGVIQAASTYHNFGATAGTSGYGFWDNGGTLEYKNSGGSWAAFGGGSAHNLLSSTHTDTVAASPTQGDLIVANGTPAWTNFAKCTSTYFLNYSGTGPQCFNLFGTANTWTATQTINNGAPIFVFKRSFNDIPFGDIQWQFPGATVAAQISVGNIGTSNEMEFYGNSSTLMMWFDLANGLFRYAGPGPTYTSGFGTGRTIAGSNEVMRINVGTGGIATTGVVTFAGTWTNAPVCEANDEGSLLMVQAVATTTTLTLTSATAWTASSTIGVHCWGY